MRLPSLNILTPLESVEGVTTGPQITLEEARRELNGKRVIIVEDEGVTQMQLRRTLTHAGLVIIGTAINGRDGSELALRERPDIVLMDVRMPIMDGMEATRRILAEARLCIVMLTAFSDEEYRSQAADLGVSGYVIKPVTSDMLLPLMLQALREFESG